MPELTQVWSRIESFAGQTFRLKRGKAFTYSVASGAIHLHTTNRMIPRSDIRRCLERLPFSDTTVPNGLGVQGPSYVYAIMMDERIRAGDW